MDEVIRRRYHTPKSRPSKRKQLAQKRAKARWVGDEKNQLLPVPEISKVESRPSTSATKLQNFSEICKNEPNCSESAYAFLNMNAINTLLENIKCSECLSGSISISCGNNFGFATKLHMQCNSCGYMYGNTYSSPRVPQQGQFEANKKIVQAFLKIGRGHAAVEEFSMILGIQSMDKKTFSKCLNSLHADGEDVRSKVLEMARSIVRKKHEEIDASLKNQPIIDISVSYDGTWHKRGHTSLYGIGIVIDVLTGLIIDYEVLSKYCVECASASNELGKESAEFLYGLKAINLSAKKIMMVPRAAWKCKRPLLYGQDQLKTARCGIPL